MSDNGALADLRNLGPRMTEMLAEVGVTSPADLREIGAVEAYCRLKLLFGRGITLMALYALCGALDDRDCLSYSQTEKMALKEQTAQSMA